MVGIRLAPALQPKRLPILGSHRTAAANIGFTVGLRPQQLSRQDTDAQAPAAPTELNPDGEGRRSYLHSSSAPPMHTNQAVNQGRRDPMRSPTGMR
jgi:hypothetical protein